jgi:uncharacterized membrane protein
VASASDTVEPDTSADIDRMVGLTDGVIAIAITLLVLDISVPAVSGDDSLSEAVWELRPEIFGFMLSFAVIAYYWLSHRLVFSHLRTIDLTLMIINLCFLLVIAFNPFATSLLAKHTGDGFAVAVYAGVMALAGIALLVMTLYPKAMGHLRPGVPTARFSRVTRKMAVAPIVFVATIPIALVNGWIAMALWLVPPAIRAVIDRRVAPDAS